MSLNFKLVLRHKGFPKCTVRQVVTTTHLEH